MGEECLTTELSHRDFGHPAEIEAAGKLTRAEKIKLLADWEYDLRLKMVAAEENMRGNERESAAELLAEVHRCLTSLGVRSPAADAPFKAG